MEQRPPFMASKSSMRVYNPIRATIDNIVHPKDSDKELIPLSIGDPTVFGNMLPHESVKQAMHKVIDSNNFNGYFNAAGSPEARKAVAQRFSTEKHPLTDNDVILASGCSGALLLALTACAGAGDNVLVPRPGFSLYPTICAYLGVECRYYNLIPDKGWDVDLDHLKSLADENTKAIIVNNPSNPCGSVWSKEHILEILDVVHKLHLPLISDEVYFDMVFHGKEFYSFGNISEDVPVIIVGGLAKRYLVPGWRLGWVVVQDRHSLLSDIRQGMYKLAQLTLGANSLVQSILPEVLHNTPKEFYEQSNRLLQEHADYLVERIEAIDGMHIIPPGGAMYIMVRIEVDKLDVKDDVDFTQKLLTEENVFVLPGTIFHAVGYVRLVVCSPIDKLKIACDRMEAFCRRHKKS